MRPHPLLLCALLLLAAPLAFVGALLESGPAAGEEEIAGIVWLTDLVAARAQAKEKSRPLLAVFR
jgi:hypothetical protein